MSTCIEETNVLASIQKGSIEIFGRKCRVACFLSLKRGKFVIQIDAIVDPSKASREYWGKEYWYKFEMPEDYGKGLSEKLEDICAHDLYLGNTTFKKYARKAIITEETFKLRTDRKFLGKPEGIEKYIEWAVTQIVDRSWEIKTEGFAF